MTVEHTPDMRHRIAFTVVADAQHMLEEFDSCVLIMGCLASQLDMTEVEVTGLCADLAARQVQLRALHTRLEQVSEQCALFERLYHDAFVRSRGLVVPVLEVQRLAKRLAEAGRGSH